MAYIAPIQSSNQANGTSPTATFTNTPAQNNLIIVSILDQTNTTALTSVKDGNSNNLTLLNSRVKGSLYQIFHYGMIATAAQSKTVKATLAGATLNLNIYEFSGNCANITNIIDNNQNNGAATTANTTNNGSQPSCSLTMYGDLVFYSIGFSATVTAPSWTASGGTAVNALQTNISGGAIRLFDGYSIETTPTTVSPFCSWTTSVTTAAVTTPLLANTGGNMFMAAV